jgi:hypothetical protein
MNEGLLEYRPGFIHIRLGGIDYDLRKRTKARLCIQYLVEKKAFDAGSARSLVRQIDPYVRKHGHFRPSKDIRIDHYFHDRGGMMQKLRHELIEAVGRDGRFFLRVRQGATAV